jgi:dUTP pyrophosphatase
MTLLDRENNKPEQRLQFVEGELHALHQLLGGIASIRELLTVDYHVFPGGRAPQRATDGAIGFDAYARALVDETSKPTPASPLRRTRGDFVRVDDAHWKDSIDENLRDFTKEDETDPRKWELHLPPNERVMVGLGIATRMAFPLFYWVAPRSGFASIGVTVANSPGTVDPDYRGEAGALVENNSRKDFVISHHMRIVQLIFSPALIPQLHEVERHGELGGTNRGAGGFGSTGAKELPESAIV